LSSERTRKIDVEWKQTDKLPSFAARKLAPTTKVAMISQGPDRTVKHQASLSHGRATTANDSSRRKHQDSGWPGVWGGAQWTLGSASHPPPTRTMAVQQNF